MLPPITVPGRMEDTNDKRTAKGRGRAQSHRTGARRPGRRLYRAVPAPATGRVDKVWSRRGPHCIPSVASTKCTTQRPQQQPSLARPNAARRLSELDIACALRRIPMKLNQGNCKRGVLLRRCASRGLQPPPERGSIGGLRPPFLAQGRRCFASAMLLRAAKQSGGGQAAAPKSTLPPVVA
jgi:hypothetical protein